MVFDLGATQQSFPLFQAISGGILLWLGLNIVIIEREQDGGDEL